MHETHRLCIPLLPSQCLCHPLSLSKNLQKSVHYITGIISTFQKPHETSITGAISVWIPQDFSPFRAKLRPSLLYLASAAAVPAPSLRAPWLRAPSLRALGTWSARRGPSLEGGSRGSKMKRLRLDFMAWMIQTFQIQIPNSLAPCFSTACLPLAPSSLKVLFIPGHFSPSISCNINSGSS